ncbi:MAG: hypothetical protein HUU60_12185, partial [Armatimonadetes bacterium]|nr:hypothetical protein [Armatimonadota bacterium]
MGLDAQGNPVVIGVGGFSEGMLAVLLKFDPAGGLLRETPVSIAGYGAPRPLGTTYLSDGSSAFVGNATPWPGGDGSDRMLVVKFDSNGEVEWRWVHEAQGNEWHSQGEAIGVDSSGNLYAGGRIVDQEGPGAHHAVDAFLVKLGPTGQMLWRARFDGRDRLSDSIRRIVVDSDQGCLYTVGTAGVEGDPPGFNRTNDILILKYDLNGNLLWSRQWNGP